MKKQVRLARLWITRLFIGCLMIVLLINIILPDKQISEVENRSLTQMPDLTFENIESGDYFKGLQSYYSDQFVGRNLLMHFNYLIQKTAGVRQIQDVYIGKGQLIEDAVKPNQKQLKRNLKAINKFSKKHKDQNPKFMLVPNAVSVQSNNLPNAAAPRNQNKDIDKVYKTLTNAKTIDVRSMMKKHADEYIYYRSDHHWTSLGAYYGAKKIDSEVKRSDFNKMPISTDFQGTLASKTGSINMKDEIDIYAPKYAKYLVTFGSTNKQSVSMYSADALDIKDQYQVFFGGNEGMINISVNNDSDKRLLIIKDSYANELIQFLIPYYRTITVIDPRYYYDDIEQQMNKDIITDVMFVYNSNTFLQDTSIADCLGE